MKSKFLCINSKHNTNLHIIHLDLSIECNAHNNRMLIVDSEKVRRELLFVNEKEIILNYNGVCYFAL